MLLRLSTDKNLGIHDTITYQLKTKWGEEYKDNESREGREYLRFKRDSSVDDWEITDKWHGLINGNKAELINENQRQIKLVFSPSLSKQWNANAYNSDENLECYYRDIHGDTTINGIHLKNTLVVETDWTPNPIDDKRYFEVYAKGIGLVYKHYRNNKFFSFNDNEVGIGKEVYYSFHSTGIE